MLHLTLTTWQRVMLIGAVNDLHGDIRLMRRAHKVLDILEFGPDEIAQVGLQEVPGGFKWDPAKEKGVVWHITLPAELPATLQQAVQIYQAWPAGQFRDVLDLCDQLGLPDDAPAVGPQQLGLPGLEAA